MKFMQYDFDSVKNRRNTNSLKWNVKENELPMWVADMDFPTAPEITECIRKKTELGIFGYSDIPEEWSKAYVSWWEENHNLKMEEDWLIFSAGVIPTVSSVVRKLTSPAEKVVLLTPVYNIFFNSVLNNGRQVSESKLVFDGENYSVDFNDLEEKLSDKQASLMILCNPHNPIGKIWDREVLRKIGDLAVKYGVTVLSDEIHCDLTDPNREYIPFASVSENCKNNSIVCLAPTKTFNLAGIQTSAVAVANPFLRHKVWRALNTDEVAEPNIFACDVAICAFTKGKNWLTELRSYIYENKLFAKKYIEENIPLLSCVTSDATYLMWLNCKKTNLSSDVLAKKIREVSGLYLSAGTSFFGDGKDFLRLNIACPRSTLTDGLKRLEFALNSI